MNPQSARKIPALFGALVLLGASLASPAGAAPKGTAFTPDRYIVVLKETTAHPDNLAQRHARNRDAQIKQVFRHAIKGYAATIPPGELQAIRQDPNVAYVEPDGRGGIAAQTTPTGIDRVFATGNKALDIDEKDDERVDADVAVFDTGIAEHPDLNLVGHIDCNGNPCEEGGTDVYGHGTHVAGTIAALDNSFGVVGVAPGARLWDVKVLDNEGFGELSELIAGIDWVTATREDEDPENDIDVTNASLRYWCCTSSKAFDEALEGSIEAGVVHVSAAGNESEQVVYLPGVNPEEITVSALWDEDGEPGEGNDPLAWFSNFGSVVDVAAPGVGIYSTIPGEGYGTKSGTSMASPHVAGAAAILASQSNPETQEDVEVIRDTIVEEGNFDWTDNSGDGVQEPLLDVGDEEIFDPAIVPGAEPQPVDSDVDGDGHADLVTLHPNGVVSVHPGNSEAKFGSAVDSFSDGEGGGTLDSAQYDGEGHYVIDVADVDGDERSDLIALADDGDVHVFAGEEGAGFDEEGATSELGLAPGLLQPGGHEPIAVADVNGDSHGDLIAHEDAAEQVIVYPGRSDATFGEGIAAATEVGSALHTGVGRHFVDAGDVNGDARADLVAMTSGGDLEVFRGRSLGTFAEPVVSHQGEVDPAMDDGSGQEAVGLGDLDGDGRADLLLVDSSGTPHRYPGQASGAFGPVVTGSPGSLSTTFDPESGLLELLGLMDVNGDGRADIALNWPEQEDAVYVGPGESNDTFGEAVASEGTFPSTQHFQNQDASGNEFVFEKPSWRRRGCDPEAGCVTPAFASNAQGIGAAGGYGGVDLYMRDSVGDVTQRWWTAGTGWSELGWHGSPPGGVTTSEPAAVFPSHGPVHVFVRGADEAIWEKVWNPATKTWLSWSSLGGVAAAIAPAAVSREEGEIQLFGAAAADNSVWRRTWVSGSGWSSWESVAETTATGLAASSRPNNPGIDLFMRDANGDITQRWWTPTTGWSGLGWHSRPPGGPAGSAPAAVSLAGSVHVFVRGADRSLWQKVWQDSSQTWSEWTSLGGVLRSAPAATSPASGQIHIFARFANDSLFRKRWSAEGGWSGWEPVY